MALTKTQQAIWERARATGAGAQGVGLSDEACAYLIGTIVHDLGFTDRFHDLPGELPAFFGGQDLKSLKVDAVDARGLFERLVVIDPDADMYFACLASLHKARLKYHEILATQPMPTLEQVGPRGLLQFGTMTPRALTGLLLWRKWLFDIDNRAGQETGYLFEPIIAHAVGGTPVPAARSPIKRHRDGRKGRQIDCLLGKTAYEIKIRVTIAASGQGRWREELDFPLDCRASGFTPVLLVLDGTPNSKLGEIVNAFHDAGGETRIGDDAWRHLDDLAGPTMSSFLEKYVRGPLDDLLRNASDTPPDLVARMSGQTISIGVGGETLVIQRHDIEQDGAGDEIPQDIDEELPG